MVSYDDEFEREYRRLEALNREERQRRLHELAGLDADRADILRLMLEPEQMPTGVLRESLIRGIDSGTAPEEIAGFHDFVPIGHGGQGSVFRAHRRGSNESFAVKLFPLTASEHVGERYLRFRREANILRSLIDPHVVAYVADGVESIDGLLWHYIAMELVDPAIDVLSFAQNRPFDLAARVALIEKMCEAIHSIHLAGVIHRDLKPKNILVGARECIRLIDFGIAHRATLDPDHTLLTRTGDVIGTPQYMSPEQADPRGAKVDLRTDVYSLGAIAYQILCDEPPIRCPGVSGPELFERISKTDPKPLHRVDPRIPVAIARVVDTALRKEPGPRYPSAREFAVQLRKAFAGEDYVARPLSSLQRLAHWVAKHRAATAAVVFALLALGAGTLAVTSEFRSQRDRLAAAASIEFASVRALSSTGNWVGASAALERAGSLGEFDPTEIELLWIDVLEGQSKITLERERIAALAKRIDSLSPVHRARVLLLSGDHTREPSAKLNPFIDREKLVAALELDRLSPADVEYTRALLAESPRKQIEHLEAAIALDPGHHRTWELLVPTCVYSGALDRAERAAYRFRDRYPQDPCSGVAMLFTRCVQGGESLPVIRGEYPEVHDSAVEQLRWLLDYRQFQAMTARAGFRVALVKRIDPQRANAMMRAAMLQILTRAAGIITIGTDDRFEPLNRLPPNLVRTWSSVLQDSVLKVLTTGFDAESIALLESMIQQNDDAFLRYTRGHAAKQNKDAKSAAVYYREAFESQSLLDVKVPAALAELGVLQELGTWSEKETAVQRIRWLMQQPDLDSTEFQFLVSIARSMSETRLARAVAAVWASRMPNDVEAEVSLGFLDLDDGNKEGARHHLERALAQSPTLVSALRLKDALDGK